MRALEREVAAQRLDNDVQLSTCGCFGLCDDGPAVIFCPEGVWYRKDLGGGSGAYSIASASPAPPASSSPPTRDTCPGGTIGSLRPNYRISTFAFYLSQGE